MSRTTVDLQAVRFFLGYGLVFILQSAVTILIATGVMLAINPVLAAVSLAPMPFMIWVAFPLRPAQPPRHPGGAAADRGADGRGRGERRRGASGEGIRPGAAPAAALRHATARVFDQSMVSTRLRAFYSPLIGFLPQLGLAGLLLVGGRQAIQGSLSIGDFVAFYGYVLMLTSPMRMLGIALGMAQRAVASGARVFEVLDREPRLTAPPGAPPLPPAPAAWSCEG